MCWICSSDNFKLQNAEEDIVVYKVLQLENGKLHSPNFNCFTWIEGETYGSPLDIHLFRANASYYFEGLQGMHSYKQNPRYDAYYEAYMFRRFYSPKRSVPVQYNLTKGMCVAKCIIPKGTTYAINEHGEVISERLQFIKLGILVDKEIMFNNVLDL